jgi:type II secretion system protein N
VEVATREPSSAWIPGALRGLGIALAAVLLTLAFAIGRFPYERLADTISNRSMGLVGIELQLNDLRPSLMPGRVGMMAIDVRAVLPTGDTLLLPAVRIRPAASLSWFRGAAALYIEIEGGELGDVAGELILGPAGGFDGALDRVNLALLPLDQLAPDLALEGRMDSVIDVSSDAEGNLQGSLSFRATEGFFGASGLPVAIPFESFEGEIALGGEVFATIERLELRGPMLDADATGSVGRAARRGAEPLAVVLELRPRGRGMRPLFRQLGIEAGPNGATELQITGTLSRPTFR